MTDKIVLITGGNGALGVAIATELARMGAHVVLTSRDPARGADAVASVRRASGSDAVETVQLDLADFTSIRRCAGDVWERFATLDVLINNAGVVLSTRGETTDGFERTFGVNHLGHFYLMGLLFRMLAASAPSRVVTVASSAHWLAPGGLDFDDLQARRRYDGMMVYARSKLANILFTRELARRIDGSGVTANSLCPGVFTSAVGTREDTSGSIRLIDRMSRSFATTAAVAARTPIQLASAPSLARVSGRHFVLGMTAPVSWAADDDAAARRLWEASEGLVEAAVARAAS